MSEKPSQKHKFRAQASVSLSLSLSLSLLLRPAFKVSKQFGSRRSLIRWVYSYTSREDFQSMYEPARCFNESFCKTLFHAIWLLITCDKGSDEPTQMCILNTVFSMQRDNIPARTQCRATIGPPAKCHPNGRSLVGRLWPAFRCVLG